MQDPSLLGDRPDSLAAGPPGSSRPSPLGRGALKDSSSPPSSPRPGAVRSPTRQFDPLLSPEFSVMEKLAEAQAGAEVARHSEAGLQAALQAMRQEHEASLATLVEALREADAHVLAAREAE